MGIFNKEGQFTVRGSFFEKEAEEVVSTQTIYNFHENLIQMPNYISKAIFQSGESGNRHRYASSGLYNKPITIVNNDSSIVNKLEASLTDDAGVVIYDRHMFIVQATDCSKCQIYGKSVLC
jgi:hypothetical protein